MFLRVPSAMALLGDTARCDPPSLQLRSSILEPFERMVEDLEATQRLALDNKKLGEDLLMEVCPAFVALR